MPFVDLEIWPRRQIYSHYLGYADPWFNLTTEIEVGETRRWASEAGVPFSLACWFAVMGAVNAVPELRTRLRPEGVWLHERVLVGAAFLREDRSFAYVYFPWAEDFPTFLRLAQARLDLRARQPDMVPDHDDDDVTYCTVVPWVRFTAIRHPRSGDAMECVPRIALGRATAQVDGVRMPVALDAHHGLVDGLHAGEFFALLQERLQQPERTFGARANRSSGGAD